MTQAGNWTPAMPLRADATDEQIQLRRLTIAIRLNDNGPESLSAVAREFAAACVAAEGAAEKEYRIAELEAAASQGTTRPTRAEVETLPRYDVRVERDSDDGSARAAYYADARVTPRGGWLVYEDVLALWDTPEGEEHGR